MITFSQVLPTQIVPDVTGMSAADAQQLLTSLGLVGRFVSHGGHFVQQHSDASVQAQVPSVGRLVTPGADVALYLT